MQCRLLIAEGSEKDPEGLNRNFALAVCYRTGTASLATGPLGVRRTSAKAPLPRCLRRMLFSAHPRGQICEGRVPVVSEMAGHGSSVGGGHHFQVRSRQTSALKQSQVVPDRSGCPELGQVHREGGGFAEKLTTSRRGMYNASIHCCWIQQEYGVSDILLNLGTSIHRPSQLLATGIPTGVRCACALKT